MFRRTTQGIALSPSSWATTRLGKKVTHSLAQQPSSPLLSGLSLAVPFESDEIDVLRQRLTDCLGQHKKQPVGLSLPDSAGHILWVPRPPEAESAQETEEMVRWSLRDRVATPHHQLRVSVFDTGQEQLLVAALHNTKAEQMEETLDRLGHRLLHLSFHSLDLWTSLQACRQTATDYLLLCQLPESAQWYRVKQGKLIAFRHKVGAFSSERLASETGRTLADWRQLRVEAVPETVWVYLDSEEEPLYQQALTGLLECPQFLATNLPTVPSLNRIALSAATAARRLA